MNPSALETAHVLSLQAGALVALALALAAALARSAVESKARADALLADNESLRSELGRLREGAARGPCAEAEAAACARFLVAMSEEMRLPIRGVLDMADLLLEGGLAPEHASYAQAIRGSGAALLGLIDNLLDAPGIEVGRSDRGDELGRRVLRKEPSQSISRAS